MPYRLLLLTFVALLVSSQALAAQAVQNIQVDLTVTRYDDHVQFQCNPMSLGTAMDSDWKQMCNDMAVTQAGKLVAAGTIAAVKGPVFDTSATNPAAGPMLVRNVPLLKPQH